MKAEKQLGIVPSQLEEPIFKKFKLKENSIVA